MGHSLGEGRLLLGRGASSADQARRQRKIEAYVARVFEKLDARAPLVDQPFDHIGDVGAAGSAIRANGGLVGVDPLHREIRLLHVVDPRHHLQRQVRGQTAHTKSLRSTITRTRTTVYSNPDVNVHGVKLECVVGDIARQPDVDAVVWIETIPYSETRNYVKILTRNLALYTGLYGTADATAPR